MPFEVSIATSRAERQICYRLRHIVFVDEQNVPVDMELDEHDETDAVHFLGRRAGEPIAAARIILADGNAKIGRMVVLDAHRGKNYGAEMMAAMMTYARNQPDIGTIVLDAQTYAMPFYQRLGFCAQGEEFMDAGIPHFHMVCPIER